MVLTPGASIRALIAALCVALPGAAMAQASSDGPPVAGPAGAPPASRPSQEAPPPGDDDLPPPAAPQQGAPAVPAPAAATPGDAPGPQGRADAATEAELAGLPLNAITIRTLIQQGNFAKALRVADAVLRRYPNDLEVAMQRARLLFWLQRPEEAEAAAVAVFQADARNTEALRLVGQIREQRGDVGGAIRAYREAQLRGDDDLRIATKLVELYVKIDRVDLARGQLRPGMALPEEVERDLVLAEHPWLVQGLLGLSYYRGDLWRRAEVGGAYRWSRQATLVLGAYGEERDRTRLLANGSKIESTAQGYGFYGQFFYEISQLSGDIRLFVAPESGAFLPPIDAWVEGAWNFGRFAVGLWGRYATFELSPLWSIGPYIPIFLGRLTLKPGYLLVGRGDAVRGDFGQLGHTVFLQSRFDFDLRDALFLWAYWGQEVVFTNRTVAAADESAVSVVAGWDHWFTHRVGVRVIGTALEQLTLGHRWYDVAVMARVRL